MYNFKSFSILSFVLVLALALVVSNSVKGVDLPFNPNDYHFLVYDPASGSNIKEAMRIILGRDLKPEEIRTSAPGNHVDANDLATHDILVVGWNGGSGSMDGLISSILGTGINGRIVLTGHDADLHTVERFQAAQKFLINAINYVLQGGGHGLICLADAQTGTNAFSYLPRTLWAIDANTVGYFKLIYHGGEVSVSFDSEYCSAIAWDEETGACPDVPFSAEPLIIGRDPNEP